MTTIAFDAASAMRPTGAAGRTWLLLAADYRRIMGSRVAWLLWGFIVYTVLMIPFILNGPQEEITRILASWIGHDATGGNIILFIWIDAAMNKLAIIMGAILGGGIIADEKARGSFDILLSKPMAAGDYFVAKLGAAVAAMATFYICADLLALATFPWRVEGFPLIDFVMLSSVHLFAALFSVIFAAMAAAVLGNRLAAMLTSIVVIGMLVGLTFLGFTYPAMLWLANANPFFHGVKLIGSIESYGLADVLAPIAILLIFNFAVAAIGRWRAISLIERGA